MTVAYRRALVPLDGSDLARSALPLATSLSRLYDGEVSLLSVIGDDDGPSAANGGGGSGQDAVAQAVTPARAQAQEYLRGVASEVRAQGITVSETIRVGDPATEIVAMSRERSADVIVMATRGRSGLVRGLLGSVTDRVIHSSSTPVLMVPAQAHAVIADRWLPRNVIVPLDGSELAEVALAHAESLCDAAGAGLMLLRAVSFPAVYATDPYGGTSAATIGMIEAEQDETRQYLAAIAGRASAGGCKAGVRVGTGHPRSEIVALAEELPDAIVVMTTRGATGLTRWVVGSVADTVIRSAPVPVLVIPPQIGL